MSDGELAEGILPIGPGTGRGSGTIGTALGICMGKGGCP